ncbi:MAG: hypothetical protein LQ346_008880 [Caloplaca aetnensis]|nr:MAG: hypothetical protein LQ346_008880 [Caloplaca aetnensis]
MHYIPIPEGDPKNNIDASEDANEEKVSLHVTNFVFKCLAVDGNSTSRAIFKLAEDIYEGFKPTIAEMMPSRMFPDQFFFDQVPEFPFLVLKHSIAIFKRVNDTKLPGLEWNAEQLELSVDWKAAKRSSNCWGIANDKSREKPRRERLRRQLHQLPPDEREQLIDKYESSAFSNLKDVRWGLSWPSDSEGEEEDDNVGDDESEDDEPKDDEMEDDDQPEVGLEDTPPDDDVGDKVEEVRP